MVKNKINLDKIDFETAFHKLEEIVEKLGNEKVNLEEMVELYQEALALKNYCSKKIDNAKMKVEVILTEGQN